jgi:hypothetical protein
LYDAGPFRVVITESGSMEREKVSQVRNSNIGSKAKQLANALIHYQLKVVELIGWYFRPCNATGIATAMADCER